MPLVNVQCEMFDGQCLMYKFKRYISRMELNISHFTFHIIFALSFVEGDVNHGENAEKNKHHGLS